MSSSEKEEDESPNFALLQSAPRRGTKGTEISVEMGWLGHTLPEWSQLRMIREWVAMGHALTFQERERNW